MHKYVIAAVFVALTSTTCLAAREFYIVKDVKSKDCNVETEKPDGTAKIMIGTSSYAKMDEAKAAMNAAPECGKENPKKKAKKKVQ
jgi:hypothetical protein